MNRRDVLRLGSLWAAPLASLSRESPATRPNVLLIISDQLHHGVLGCASHPVVKTPHIDRIAAEGARFENAVCPTPFCSPTRASIISGLYPHKHGITFNVSARRIKQGFKLRLPSTENILFENGYQCGQKGKWHLGEKTELAVYKNDPEADYFAYVAEATKDLPSPLAGALTAFGRPVYPRAAVKQAIAKMRAGGHEIHRNFVIGRRNLPIEHERDSWVASNAIKQLRPLAGKPFFMTCSFTSPHALWSINEPYYSMYERSRIPLPDSRNAVLPDDRNSRAWLFGQALGDEGMREYLGVYYGMVSMMDWNVGRVLDALRELGQQGNTLVIFTADHGDMQGGHGMYGKSTAPMYEETTRIPLLMRFPGKIPAGKVVRTQAGSCDIQPTILDYLGLKSAKGVQGRSLRPYLEGAEDPGRPIFSERETGNRVRRMIRTLEWKYQYDSRGSSLLFHLAKDPGETQNLIEDQWAAGIKQELHAELLCWMRETQDPRLADIPELGIR